MSQPVFSKPKRSGLFGRFELPAKLSAPAPTPELSGTVPRTLETPTPALPPAPSDWVLDSSTLPMGGDGASDGVIITSTAGLPAWRLALLGEVCPIADGEIAQRIRETPLETLNAPEGLSACNALMDACRHGFMESIHAALDQGVDARAKTTQAFSALDLIVVRAMNDDHQNDAQGPRHPTVEWLINPQERHLLAVERLLENGAAFDPELLPFLAASPLGVRLEQRALRAAIAPRGQDNVSPLPSRPRPRF